METGLLGELMSYVCVEVKWPFGDMKALVLQSSKKVQAD